MMHHHRAERAKFGAFTLIELLIVVAIIAILAAIAVPNFLEAQVRAKVSRTLTDMRSMKTAIEAYAVDNNRYPETDTGLGAAGVLGGHLSVFRLTTPISYITTIFQSPWNEQYGGDKIATDLNSYLYVRAAVSLNAPNDSDGDGILNDYETDRDQYIVQGVLMPTAQRQAITSSGSYLMKSVGPNNVDDRDTSNPDAVVPARIYDPTNGTTSGGDILAFSDRPGSFK